MRHRDAEAGDSTDASRVEGVSLSELSPYALCAVVGAEDPAFFQHRGIWWSQLARKVVRAAVTRRRVSAVSTITQQLARNLYLHPGRSLGRKLVEALLARRLEGALTKARILELYLNVAEWGAGVWGIGVASRVYFALPASALNPFQAVVLASLLPAPRAPLAGRNLARALDSQLRLLFFLYGSGVISVEEELQTRARVMELGRLLHAGCPALPVLRGLGSLPYERTDGHGPPPTIERLLETRCGLELRDAFGRLLHGPTPYRTWYARRPLWWTGSLLQ